MKIQILNRSKIVSALALLTLFMVLVSCKISAPGSKSSASQAAPATQPPANSAPNLVRPGNLPEGGTDLTDPLTGMDGFSSFRQSLSLTLKGSLNGKPYEESQQVERDVVDVDQSVRVKQQTSNNAPVDLFYAQMGDYDYSQDQEDASCRAGLTQDHASTIDLNPALRLPAAFGMQESGREKVNGLDAIHYTFNERSLMDRDGVIGKADGKVWLAEGSGVVLKYDLTVALSSKDFSGTRSWTYSFKPDDQGLVIHLPAACQPVLADLPVMPGAVDILTQPGFQHYRVSAARSEAVEFYHDQLPDQGWRALPGSAPDQADLESAVTVLSFVQPYLDGGRVLVVQLSEQDNLLGVTAQTVLTKQPVGLESESSNVPSSDEMLETPDPESSPSSGGVLPTDLPIYPGAKIVTQMESVMLLEMSASNIEVADFYLDALQKAGWALDQKVENAQIMTQLWSRDGESMAVSIMKNGNATQVTLTAITE